jgi:hypothetical protein
MIIAAVVAIKLSKMKTQPTNMDPSGPPNNGKNAATAPAQIKRVART